MTGQDMVKCHRGVGFYNFYALDWFYDALLWLSLVIADRMSTPQLTGVHFQQHDVICIIRLICGKNCYESQFYMNFRVV